MTSETIHRVWLGSKMPEDYADYGQQFLDMNPGWSLHDWTEEEVFDTKWQNQAVINMMTQQSKNLGADRIAYYTHVVDVIDYEILYRESGLYLNTDIKPVRPLTHLDPPLDYKPVLAMEDDVHPVNMAMYAPHPFHPFFGSVIDALPDRYWSNMGTGMPNTTGVQLLMQVLRQRQWDIDFWHRDVWNPIHWGDIPFGTKPDLDRDYPKSTVGSHFWTHRLYQRSNEILP
jgi:mannosyltransferase OCH1-like enzyme